MLAPASQMDQRPPIALIRLQLSDKQDDKCIDLFTVFSSIDNKYGRILAHHPLSMQIGFGG